MLLCHDLTILFDEKVQTNSLYYRATILAAFKVLRNLTPFQRLSLITLTRLFKELTTCPLTSSAPRTERDDSHQIPLFALSEETGTWRDRGGENRAACVSRTTSPQSDTLDATTLDAATDFLEEFIDGLSATEASDLMQGSESIDGGRREMEEYRLNDIREAASFSAARPPNAHEVCEMAKSNPTQDCLLDYQMFSPSTFPAFHHPFGLCHHSGLHRKESLLTSISYRSLEQRETSLIHPLNSPPHLIGL